MKILYVDTGIVTGHYLNYLNSLKLANDDAKNTAIYLLSHDSQIKNAKTYNYKWNFAKPKYADYKSLIRKITKVVLKHEIEIVHFLSADFFIRFFGVGLGKIKCKKIFTFHKILPGILKKVSYCRIFNHIDMGVVHTKHLKTLLETHNKIKNVTHIEYPIFNFDDNFACAGSKAVYGISSCNKVLSAVGGTRTDKGLDDLLKALNIVINYASFHLLIAGVNRGFDENFIQEYSLTYSENVTTKLSYLTNEEFFHSINCSDIIVLPYKKSFEGASGPLTEGVALGKIIIGPNHGSLGDIITNNHLGYTFESENVEDLAKTILQALSEGFVYDEIALNYQDSLKEANFQNKYMELYNEVLQ